nr:putative reverse transcriptase domain-containing protein [Tanacetum cinerariifolium]
VKFEWGDKQEAVFQLLKQKLCSAPILALPEGSEDFIVYCDASIKGLGDVLMQREKKMAPKRTTRSKQVPPVTPAGVAAAMAEAEASRVRNGYGSNGSGPRLAQAVRELTQWFEKMESVFNINNCTAACQVKYAACTLQGVALTWWNSHVKTVTLEVAQALPWKTLKKMMTDIVKAAKPKTMQEAIEFATELMDKRIRDAVKNKRKFEGTSGNNQYQPQQNKR